MTVTMTALVTWSVAPTIAMGETPDLIAVKNNFNTTTRLSRLVDAVRIGPTGTAALPPTGAMKVKATVTVTMTVLVTWSVDITIAMEETPD